MKCFIQRDRDTDESSEEDDDDLLRAHALDGDEEFVASFARKNGNGFDTALGQLLSKGTLSSRSSIVKMLNFNNPAVRGSDLLRSILYMDKFSNNSFSFKSELSKEIGAKSENDLNKKIMDFEFKNPMFLIGALLAQFNRFENRYILSGISFQEAFARRLDFCNTLGCICFDLYKIGINEGILQYIRQFSSEFIDPKFDFVCINDDNTSYIANSTNDNNNNKIKYNNNSNASICDRFALDKNELLFNINDDIGCQIKLTSPCYELYNKNRSFIYNSKKNTLSLKERWTNGERPKFCPNKSCWDFNFGIDGCPHASICKIKSDLHILNFHYCAFCGIGSIHPILQCPFIRCVAFLIRCNNYDWINKIYPLKTRQPQQFRNNYNNNSYNNNRRKNSTRGGGRGGRGMYHGSFGGHDNYNNSYKEYDGYGEYDEYNDNYHQSHQQQQQHNGRRRSKRHGGGNNNGQFNNPPRTNG